MLELASEYMECVLGQTWPGIPTVNVGNGKRVKWELKRFPYFQVRFPSLLSSVFWSLSAF